MHGVPHNLSLAAFQGATLELVGLGPFIVHLHFAAEPRAVIGIEGDWELRDQTGALIDHQMDPAERDAYRLHVLLDHAVVAREVSAPESFLLRFDSGHTLRVFDRSAEYESFSIQPGDIHV